MQSVTSIVLSQSGQPLVVPNGLVDTTSISIVYSVAGSPASLTITVVGVKNSAGECAVLDTYSGVVSTTRAINLSDTFDSFKFCAVWAPTGASNISVGVAVSSTGAGPVFSSSSLPAIQVYDAP